MSSFSWAEDQASAEARMLSHRDQRIADLVARSRPDAGRARRPNPGKGPMRPLTGGARRLISVQAGRPTGAQWVYFAPSTGCRVGDSLSVDPMLLANVDKLVEVDPKHPPTEEDLLRVRWAPGRDVEWLDDPMDGASDV